MIAETRAETSKADLVSDLHAMGVSNRHVMVHSSYKLLAPVEDGPKGVVDAFVKAVDAGTLLFPTYDFTSWTERGYWSRDDTPSQMGVISETARTDPRFWRTTHPVLSYAVYHDAKGGRGGRRVWGYGDDVVNAHGLGSVFDRLVRNRGLLISIGAEKQTGFRANDTGFTISNHAALLAGAHWRKIKVFEGLYQGKGSMLRRYALSVNADPTKYVTQVTPAHVQAEKEGVIQRMTLGRTECWVADAAEFVEWAIQAHRDRPELWFTSSMMRVPDWDWSDV